MGEGVWCNGITSWKGYALNLVEHRGRRYTQLAVTRSEGGQDTGDGIRRRMAGVGTESSLQAGSRAILG